MEKTNNVLKCVNEEKKIKISKEEYEKILSLIQNEIEKGELVINNIKKVVPKVFYNNIVLEGHKYKDALGVNPKQKKKDKLNIYFDYIKKNTQFLSNGFPTCAGVYGFVAKEEIELVIYEEFKNFVALRLGANNEINFSLLCTPKLNLYNGEDKNKIKINKGELIYVGEANNLKKRYDEHYSDKIDKCNSMKFGIRKELYKKVEYFCIKLEETDPCFNGEKGKEKIKEYKTQIESYLRNFYGVRFGK